LEHRVLDEHRAVIDADVPDADVVVATWWETAPAVAELSQSKGAKAYFVQDYGAHDGQPLADVALTWHLPLHKLTISEWLVQLIAECCGDQDVTYVPNSVDFNLFSAFPREKQARPTVGFMYSARPQKGTGHILAALDMAAASIPDLRVLSYGPSDPVRDLPLPARVEYHKHVPDERLAGIYAQCDAWLFASTKEGFGLPILEAMACRTPVIATPSGAAPELLARGGGLLVGPNAPAELAGAIERVAGMSEREWRDMSETALETAQAWTWDSAVERFEAGLHKAIAKSGSAFAAAG
jgi:glycosyltransferase involved in cell wall biosynthesis